MLTLAAILLGIVVLERIIPGPADPERRSS